MFYNTYKNTKILIIKKKGYKMYYKTKYKYFYFNNLNNARGKSCKINAVRNVLKEN